MKKTIILFAIAILAALTIQPTTPTTEQQCITTALAELSPKYWDMPSIVEMCQQ